MDKNTIFEVKNRSNSMVAYSIPEMGISRLFQPGETRKLSFEELERLSYQPGGRILIADYLQYKEIEVNSELNIKTEPEYYLTEEQLVDLLKNGSKDQFLDCLDFAPKGVIEIIKDLSVKMPLEDYNKRQALKEKIGFDVDAAIQHYNADKNEKEDTKAHERRVNPSTSTGRRTDGKYTIISK